MNPMPASLSPRQRHATKGFTLIEVMIVVAIIGILAAIAYPSYREYVIRGRLVDATNGLSEMRARMERHFQDNRSYMTVGAFQTPCAVAQTYGDFVVTCGAGPTATTYRLDATANAGTVVDGFRFTVNELDQRATAAAPAGWTVCATRWITKKGVPCV
jgi:type IV pilus assembly protein PilE